MTTKEETKARFEISVPPLNTQELWDEWQLHKEAHNGFDNYLAYCLVNERNRHSSEYVERDSFKSFHKNLCERFGYHHDNLDYKRDLASLEEHIAKKLQAAEEREKILREAIDELVFCSQNFLNPITRCLSLSKRSLISAINKGKQALEKLNRGEE